MEQTLNAILTWFSGFPEWALCLILFGLALVQYIFPPIPSDTLLVALGILVSQGVFNRFLGFGAYSLGAAIGALALFTVAYILGDRVRKIKLINRLIDDKTYEKAKTAIDKYGGGSYFLLRFIPSMQCITIIVMGLMKVKKEKAHFYVTCVTVLACAVYYLLGVLLGSNIPMLLRILDTFGNVGKILLAVLIAVITAAVIIFKLKNKDKNKKS